MKEIQKENIGICGGCLEDGTKCQKANENCECCFSQEKETECEFYEIDEKAKTENDDWWNSLPESMKKELETYEGWYDEQNPEPSPIDKCGILCKHLCSGKSYPGEYVDYCSAPGNEHIINVDVNLAEVI